MAAAVENTPRNREGKSGKERILTAAEQLFAQHGFDGVSVRDITEAALVDVALVSYHFGGKRELFAALFQRRAEQLNAERSLCLQAAIEAARPGTPDIVAVINSYLQPMLRLSMEGDPGWKYYFQIVAQVNNSPHWAPVLMTRHFDPGAEKLVATLHQALPGASPERIFWAIQFLAGSLTMTFAQTGRIDRMSGGLCTSTDLKTALERLVPYAAAGFRALASPSATDGAAKVPRTPSKKPRVEGRRPKSAHKTAKVAKKRT